jgi:glycosidase
MTILSSQWKWRRATHTTTFLFILAASALYAVESGGDKHERHPFADEVIYFLLIDRFNDSDPSNNAGGYVDADGRLLLPADDRQALRDTVDRHGYNPDDFGYYQGGDFKGVRDKLGYIQGLGVTAIWFSPVFKNKPVQWGSAGYHGYWILDFTTVDPHFGSEEDFRDLVEAIHARGMKVYLDIVVNHTADVIYFSDDDYNFRLSRPHPPTMNTEELHAKTPAWLNNPDNYHNLGNFLENDRTNPLYGQSSLLGDFSGLDDLATERQEVIDGMIAIYSDWIRKYRINGFRLNTAKHVDFAFWRAFCPAILRIAREEGIPDFRIFGEVSDEEVADGIPAHGARFLSELMRGAAMPSVLDFGFWMAARDFAARDGSPERLRELFASDSWYSGPGVNAHDLPTFLGNHDFGRIGYGIVKSHPDESRADWVSRDELAHALMFFSRGVPTLYYGDEQGFTGSAPGDDKSSRQPMFDNSIPQYRNDPILGSDRKPMDSHFDTEHPLYRTIGLLAELRREHAALRRGAQIPRLADSRAGLFAFSRLCLGDPFEYVAVFNNATESRQGRIDTYYPAGTSFRQVYPASDEIIVTENAGRLPVDFQSARFKPSPSGEIAEVCNIA